jgi:peptidyl-prolyl cis-trans isomerase B (cyclophilin B)
MRMAVALAVPALALAAVAAASPPAAAKDPPFRLTAACDKKEVALGEKIPVQVRLQSGRARASSVAEMRLGAPQSVMFLVSVDGGKLWQVAPLLGNYNSGPFKPDPLDRQSLKPGESMRKTIDLHAIQTGKWSIRAIYGGIEKSDWDGVLEAAPIEVVVKPGPKGETRVGARLVTDAGAMTAELYPGKAFNTVHNFWSLASSGFYKDLKVHRIKADFMIQMGCPKGDGTGNPGYAIAAEFNDISHEKGVLSMARQGNHINTAGCQIFVMTVANPGLDRQYTGFGRLVDGTAVLDTLAKTPVKAGPNGEVSQPLVPPLLRGVEPVLLPPPATAPAPATPPGK